jgi:hypothetical protein
MGTNVIATCDRYPAKIFSSGAMIGLPPSATSSVHYSQNNDNGENHDHPKVTKAKKGYI